MKNKKRKVPRILLIGAGRFGVKHLKTLKRLEEEGELLLLGAVVKTKKSQKLIEKEYGIRVWTKITKDLLKQVDAVVIITPPETHLKIALECLPFTNVFMEKPLAMSSKEAEMIATLAKKYGRKLMVGHIFRFDPLVKKLKILVTLLKNKELSIKGKFINPISNDVGRIIPFEMIHFFDIVDYIFPKITPNIISSSNQNRVDRVSVQYTKNIHAEFELGWEGSTSSRSIEFQFSNKKFICNFLDKNIQIIDFKNNSLKIITCKTKNDPLTDELLCFLDILKKKKISYPDLKVGIKLVEIAERSKVKKPLSKVRPKVAIIGAGIFGTSCAIELGKFCDITVFEKNNDIMQEASFVNQYRHHWGYHYPRSGETVKDIRKAIGDFEELYEKAIIRNFPTYYFIAKKGSKVSAKQYIKFCNEHSLPFTLGYPEKGFVDKSKVSLSMKTLEPIYDYKKLKNLVGSQIDKSNIKLKLNTEVVGGEIDTDSKKIITYIDKNEMEHREKFDHVINATYAKYNQFTKWFNFPTKPMRIDLVEALIVKLPIPKISLAIMDGPFTNLVPTNDDSLFTLVHIKESILQRYVPKNGLPNLKKPSFNKIKKTLEESAKWLPIINKAELAEVRYVFRAVNANREHDDARPSDMTYHGFGCWSILGGKIINSVSTAKEIAQRIKNS